jgi:RimJ/RimL family protein N-acetyltransferase
MTGFTPGLFFTPQVVEGDGVRLRPWRASDIEVLPKIANDPELARFMQFPSPYTAEAARSWVEEGSAWGSGSASFAITDPVTGEVLGGTGIGSLHAARSQAEIGYWVAREARRRGVAAATVQALTAWAFENGIYRLELLAAKENGGSQRVAMNAGFTREGVRREASPDREGNRRDLVAFARLHTDPPGPTPRRLPDFLNGELTDGVVTIRPLRPDDVEPYYALYQLPEVDASTIGGEMTYADAIRKCTTVDNGWLAGEHAECVVADAATGVFAGEISLSYWQPMLREVMIGYSLSPEFRGRGVMTRAVNLLTEWAFSIGAVRVKAGTFRGNTASQRVLERAGFTKEAEAQAFLPGRDGSRIDDIQYVRISPKVTGYQAKVSSP